MPGVHGREQSISVSRDWSVERTGLVETVERVSERGWPEELAHSWSSFCRSGRIIRGNFGILELPSATETQSSSKGGESPLLSTNQLQKKKGTTC